MGDILKEGELEFDFTRAIKAYRFDDRDIHGMNEIIKPVDFIVEWDNDIWFVEVKDPIAEVIPFNYKKTQLKKFAKKLQDESLFAKELGPKIRESFLYNYLAGQLSEKPLNYFVFLALDMGPEDSLHLSDRLSRFCWLKGPEGTVWVKSYIKEALIFNEKTWNANLKQCPVKRVSNSLEK